MPETAKIDKINALRIADAKLGARASGAASREAKSLIDRIVDQAKNA
jgi:hypothetical protein